MTTGERIQNLRKQQGLSQEQLASMLHVSRQTVSKWESDTHLPELEKCMELCRIFNISLDELLLGEENKKTNIRNEELQQLILQL